MPLVFPSILLLKVFNPPSLASVSPSGTPVVAGVQGTVDVAKRGALGTLLDPTLEGLQPTVAGLGLPVLNPVVAGVQSTVDVA